GSVPGSHRATERPVAPTPWGGTGGRLAKPRARSACGSPAELGRDLGGEVRLLALNAFAERHADESGQLDRRADFLLGGLENGLHFALAVDDIGLLEQDDLLVELP